jgi:hypothetical protein
VVSVALNDCDPTSVIEDFVSETSSLVGYQLPGDPVHGERDFEINKGSRDIIVGARSHALGASGIHDQLKIVVIGQEMAL